MIKIIPCVLSASVVLSSLRLVLISFAGILVFPVTAVMAQDGPLTPTGLIGRAEIILVYDEIYYDDPATINERGLKLRKDYEAVNLNQRLSTREKETRAIGSFNSRHIDIISGDFNNDLIAEYLYTSSGENDTLRLSLVSVDTAMQPKSRTEWTVGGKILEGKNLVWGDVNGDQMAEFAVAFKEFGSNSIRIGIYGINASLEISQLDIIDDLQSLSHLTLAFGDFDGNAEDELVVGFKSLSLGEDYFLKVYDFGTAGQPVPKEATPVNLPDNKDFCYVAVTAADFDGNGKDEIITAFGRNESDSPNNDDTYIYPATVSDDMATAETDLLEKLTFYGDLGVSDRLSFGECRPMVLKSGDINGDHKTDIILGTSKGIKVYNLVAGNVLTDQFEMSKAANHNDKAESSVNFLEIADITGDGKDDVLMADHDYDGDPSTGTQFFTLHVFEYDSAFEETHIAYLSNFERIDKNTTVGSGEFYRRHYGIAAADFDGEIFRLGEYTGYACWQEVVTPVAVLNTPPVHIDYVNGVVRDISNCFGRNDCESSIQKSEGSSNTSTYSIRASYSGDWGYSPRVNYFGLDIGKLFGGDLEQVSTTHTSISETRETFTFQTASMDEHQSSDDAILATVCNYEKWEYPLFGRDEEPLGNIVVVQTSIVKDQKWINGKNIMDISGLLPLHEQGNLLSYRKFYDTIQLKNVNQDIRKIISVASDHTLDNNSSYEESITWSKNFVSENVSRTNTVEVNPSTGIDFYGIDYFELVDESTAEDETIETHHYEVGESFGIKILANELLGDNYAYSVRPYYYWSKNGALVVDYMVDLGQGSFWSDNYSAQDPGFLFPNRLDSVKAKTDESKITDPDEYLKTPSVFLVPAAPNTGDTVTIKAVIHNLSLSPTTAPVGVKFYLGDPEKGGTLLQDVSGNISFTTDEAIGDQNYARVEMLWKADFKVGDRIYCMIDPDNNLSENKEDNNLGWTPVQRFSPGCSTITSIEKIPYREPGDKYGLAIYPNPATFSINFNFSGPGFVNGNISIVDLNGKILRILDIDNASDLNSIVMNTSDLYPGTYLLVLRTANYIQHSRIVIR